MWSRGPSGVWFPAAAESSPPLRRSLHAARQQQQQLWSLGGNIPPIHPELIKPLSLSPSLCCPPSHFSLSLSLSASHVRMVNTPSLSLPLSPSLSLSLSLCFQAPLSLASLFLTHWTAAARGSSSSFPPHLALCCLFGSDRWTGKMISYLHLYFCLHSGLRREIIHRK